MPSIFIRLFLNNNCEVNTYLQLVNASSIIIFLQQLSLVCVERFYLLQNPFIYRVNTAEVHPWSIFSNSMTSYSTIKCGRSANT